MYVLRMIRIFGLLMLTFWFHTVRCQTIDFNNTKTHFSKKNSIKVTGGINSNLIGYTGNSDANRNQLTYNVTGNVNLLLFNLINLPFSFNYTNSGSQLSLPTTPNRLAVHPKYKSITAHLGDINMTYSPYTVNGHQFTGAAIDFDSKSPLKLSALYGRFQRKVEYDSLMNPEKVQPSYQRFGLGTKIEFVKKEYRIGIIVFSAKDQPNSIFNKPDTLLIFPQQNLVASFSYSLKPFKGFELKGEQSTCAISRDIRDSSVLYSKRMLSNFMPTKNSTAFFNAQKIGFNFTLKKLQIGFGYEKIDPGYKTLGAYFFANDLENVTFQLTRPFIKNKLLIAANVGIQRDDLDGSKSGTNKRFICAVNTTITPSKRINISTNYSNFQTYLHIKNQFQFINQNNQLQQLDTLNFTQIAQNFNNNTQLFFKQNKRQTQILLINLAAQKTASKQGSQVKSNEGNLFINTAIGYAINLIEKKLSLTCFYNLTIIKLEVMNNIIQGPTLALSRKLYKNKLTIGFSSSFNRSTSSSSLIANRNITNVRIYSSFEIKKKHQLNFSFGNQWISTRYNGIGNLGYSFRF